MLNQEPGQRDLGRGGIVPGRDTAPQVDKADVVGTGLLVGDLEFIFGGLQLPDQPGSTMYAYTTAAGSPAEERIRILGSLVAAHSPGSAAADHKG